MDQFVSEIFLKTFFDIFTLALLYICDVFRCFL